MNSSKSKAKPLRTYGKRKLKNRVKVRIVNNTYVNIFLNNESQQSGSKAQTKNFNNFDLYNTSAERKFDLLFGKKPTTNVFSSSNSSLSASEQISRHDCIKSFSYSSPLNLPAIQDGKSQHFSSYGETSKTDCSEVSEFYRSDSSAGPSNEIIINRILSNRKYISMLPPSKVRRSITYGRNPRRFSSSKHGEIIENSTPLEKKLKSSEPPLSKEAWDLSPIDGLEKSDDSFESVESEDFFEPSYNDIDSNKKIVPRAKAVKNNKKSFVPGKGIRKSLLFNRNRRRSTLHVAMEEQENCTDDNQRIINNQSNLSPVMEKDKENFLDCRKSDDILVLNNDSEKSWSSLCDEDIGRSNNPDPVSNLALELSNLQFENLSDRIHENDLNGQNDRVKNDVRCIINSPLRKLSMNLDESCEVPVIESELFNQTTNCSTHEENKGECRDAGIETLNISRNSSSSDLFDEFSTTEVDERKNDKEIRKDVNEQKDELTLEAEGEYDEEDDEEEQKVDERKNDKEIGKDVNGQKDELTLEAEEEYDEEEDDDDEEEEQKVDERMNDKEIGKDVNGQKDELTLEAEEEYDEDDDDEEEEQNDGKLGNGKSFYSNHLKNSTFLFCDEDVSDFELHDNDKFKIPHAPHKDNCASNQLHSSKLDTKVPFDFIPGKKYRRSLAALRHQKSFGGDVLSSNFNRHSIIRPSEKLRSCSRRTLLTTFKEMSNETITFINVDEDKNAAKDHVLELCNQNDILSFNEVFTESSSIKAKKIGEGVYGEVFMLASKVKKERTVVKIIPIEGDQEYNGEIQKKFHEIISEIYISVALSNLKADDFENAQFWTDAYCNIIASNCLKGKYPSFLVELWNDYDREKGSENDSPVIFGEDQLYISLKMSNGGEDLQNHVFASARQSYNIVMQVIYALAVAERAFEFEHRDLHIGNILISKTQKKTIDYKIDGKDFSIQCFNRKATIIDYTLSRIYSENQLLYNDIGKDEDMFIGQGDIQFQVYRDMREDLGNEWQLFKPKTNIRWIHYLAIKCVDMKYTNSNAVIHKAYISKLKTLADEIVCYDSAYEYVIDTHVH